MLAYTQTMQSIIAQYMHALSQPSLKHIEGYHHLWRPSKLGNVITNSVIKVVPSIPIHSQSVVLQPGDLLQPTASFALSALQRRAAIEGLDAVHGVVAK